MTGVINHAAYVDRPAGERKWFLVTKTFWATFVVDARDKIIWVEQSLQKFEGKSFTSLKLWLESKRIREGMQYRLEEVKEDAGKTS